MPDKGTAQREQPKRWRKVKLADGRTVQVAIVKKAGAVPADKGQKKGRK